MPFYFAREWLVRRSDRDRTRRYITVGEPFALRDQAVASRPTFVADRDFMNALWSRYADARQVRANNYVVEADDAEQAIAMLNSYSAAFATVGSAPIGDLTAHIVSLGGPAGVRLVGRRDGKRHPMSRRLRLWLRLDRVARHAIGRFS